MRSALTGSLRRFLLRLVRDRRRGELLEYAMIGAAVSLIAVIFTAAARWFPPGHPFE